MGIVADSSHLKLYGVGCSSCGQDQMGVGFMTCTYFVDIDLVVCEQPSLIRHPNCPSASCRLAVHFAFSMVILVALSLFIQSCTFTYM